MEQNANGYIPAQLSDFPQLIATFFRMLPDKEGGNGQALDHLCLIIQLSAHKSFQITTEIKCSLARQ